MSLLQDAWMSQMAASEPWPNNAVLYKPVNQQILIDENASCLAVQAYLRMCGLDTKISTKANAEFMSPSGKLPVLSCGTFVISEPTPIADFVKHKGLGLGKDLSEKQLDDLSAYTELVSNTLVPAEIFAAWGHEETFKQITRKRYSCPYPWPLNHLLCWKKQQSALTYLEGIGWGRNQCSLATVEEQVRRCCQAFSQKLGNNIYFFGDEPTEFDALLFGHLYTLITTKLPDNRLAETVRSFSSLINFCKNIDQKYFGEEFLQCTNCDCEVPT